MLRRDVRTSIGVRLGAVAVLQPVGPRALVLGPGHRRLPDAVAALEALRPLAAVQPPPARLHAQPVPLAVLPVALEVAPAEMNADESRRVLIIEGHFRFRLHQLQTGGDMFNSDSSWP